LERVEKTGEIQKKDDEWKLVVIAEEGSGCVAAIAGIGNQVA